MVINQTHLEVFMKKRKKAKELQDIAIKNPVAKFAGQFNRAQVFKDKTKYQRKAKHQGKEPFPIILPMLLEKALFEGLGEGIF